MHYSAGAKHFAAMWLGEEGMRQDSAARLQSAVAALCSSASTGHPRVAGQLRQPNNIAPQ